MEFSRANRFTINARELNIAWSDNPDNWIWLPIRETNSEVANLKTVRWLDIKGKFDTTNLPLWKFYQVVFVIKLEEDSADGWETPVNLKLTMSKGSTQCDERSVSLKEHVGKGWVDISAGEFITSLVNAGEISFSLYENDSGLTRKGLWIKGATIRLRYEENSNSEMDFQRGSQFMINARQLGITWSDNPNYWTWLSIGETDPEVANLKAVCWLDVYGTFNTKNLSLSTLYEVIFVVKLEDTAYGWETPVNLKLTMPEGLARTEEKSVSLKEHIGKGWVDLSVGEFMATAAITGEISFSLFEKESNLWKTGLLVKGVAIRPK